VVNEPANKDDKPFVVDDARQSGLIDEVVPDQGAQRAGGRIR